MKALLKKAWRVLRELTGDDAYDRYCAHHHKYHPTHPILTAREFYLAEQQRRWNGVKRCC